MRAHRSLHFSLALLLSSSPFIGATLAPFSHFASKAEGSSVRRSLPRAGVKSPYATRGTASPLVIPRGGATNIVTDAWSTLTHEMSHGVKSDALVMLSATALNPPICKQILKISPILGYLLSGLVLGPKGVGLVKDIHLVETLADVGVVLFLFEMGLHLSFSTLVKMKTDVFGLGGAQFVFTAIVVALISKFLGNQSNAASLILGWGLALSSSAFVLQLLKDKGQLSSKYGTSSFAILLLQDLMVVPLLVLMPILHGMAAPSQEGIPSVSVTSAVVSALVRTILAVSSIGIFGRFGLEKLFDFVASARNQEAFVSLILLVVLGQSFWTEGWGLSNTLGAFLAGVFLADSKHLHHVEEQISPFRGILVGLFFFAVGFEIDLPLIQDKFSLVAALVVGLILLKTGLATLACRLFDVPTPTARRVGMVLCQGGEFAFVAFRMARSLGLLSDDVTKLMLTVVSLTMAVTPFWEDIGEKIERKGLEDNVITKKKKK